MFTAIALTVSNIGRGQWSDFNEKTAVSAFWTTLYILTAVTLLMKSSFES